jgi:hypothetical protein
MTINIMKTLTLSLIFLGLVGCSNSNDEITFTPQDITPVLIGKGVLYGAGSENIPQQNIVISTPNLFSALINLMNSSSNVSDSFVETEVNFELFQLIAVFDEVRGSVGYSIDSTSVTENNENIIVTVIDSATNPVLPVSTQPFHIVKIPKSTKPIVFQIN